MSNIEGDQSSSYREYFQLIQEFNAANDRYTTSINEAAKRRQFAIENAVRIHIDPFVNSLRVIQAIGIAFGCLAMIILCAGVIYQWSALILLVLLAVFVVCLIASVWSLSRVARLRAEMQRAKEQLPKWPA